MKTAKGKKAVVNYTVIDGLVVRKTEDGKWAIYDTLTKKFVGTPKKSNYRVTTELSCQRDKSCRPLIVRWIYGLPVAGSSELGITALTYGEYLSRDGS